MPLPPLPSLSPSLFEARYIIISITLLLRRHHRCNPPRLPSGLLAFGGGIYSKLQLVFHHPENAVSAICLNIFI